MRSFETLQALADCVGQEVALSDWVTVGQARIDQFAQATGDHQWIHVDPERASAGPFGGTIAHGFLSLSLIPQFFDSSISVASARMGINYGLNKVRFVAPVLAGSRLRGRITLTQALPWGDQGAQGLQLMWDVTVECEGSDKPVCVAQMLSRLYA